MALIYKETPILDLNGTIVKDAGVQLSIKREDLNHPYISGNKWWKLNFNLEQAKKEGHSTLLTFGGAYSNHLYATAAAAKEMGFKSIGMVRGEETLPLNATLSFAKSQGMELHYVSREKYKDKESSDFLMDLKNNLGNFYLIPEGGTNELAIKGTEEWATKLKEETSFDYLCLPVGTGGTMAGMVNVLKDKKIIGFSSLKGGQFLFDEVRKWIKEISTSWTIETSYHFGGYAKTTTELIEFIKNFEKQWGIPLDQVYTAKMIYGILDLVDKQYFERGSKILILHTGGLQGKTGINFE